MFTFYCGQINEAFSSILCLDIFGTRFVQSTAASEQLAGFWCELTGTSLSESLNLRQFDIDVGGWASAGIYYNPSQPENRMNGPVKFNDRANEFHLNQFNLFWQSELTKLDHWDMGGRVDVMLGTDARFTQATGLDDELISENDFRFYDLAIPQAFVTVYAPVGNGLTLQFGHFYSLLGSESVASPNNFFTSHTYVMPVEPFTHTGALFEYSLDDHLSVSGGGVLGWDNFSKDYSRWNFLGNIVWHSDNEETLMSLAASSGDVSRHSNNHTMYTLIVEQQLSEQWRYRFQHDLGFEEHGTASNRLQQWYGLSQYLFYDVNPQVSFGLRFEWFRDDDGGRVLNEAASYYNVTFGLNWEPSPWIRFRPEIRYDWADKNGVAVFDDDSQNQQWLMGGDILLIF